MRTVRRPKDSDGTSNGCGHEDGAHKPLADAADNQAAEHQHQRDRQGGNDDQPDAADKRAADNTIENQHLLSNAWGIPEERPTGQGVGHVGPGERAGHQPKQPMGKDTLQNTGYDNGGG